MCAHVELTRTLLPVGMLPHQGALFLAPRIACAAAMQLSDSNTSVSHP